MYGFDAGTRVELHRELERGMARDLERSRMIDECRAERRAERAARRAMDVVVERRRATRPAHRSFWVRLTGRSA